MKTTTKYKFKLLEASDAVSIAPLNDNAKAMESALIAAAGALADESEKITEDLTERETALKDLIELRVMMTTGSYDGNGGKSKSIETPGFTPSLLLMFCERDVSDLTVSQTSAKNVKYESSDSACTGFAMWNGADINTAYWYENGTNLTKDPNTGEFVKETAYSQASAKVKFTASSGKLKWELDGVTPGHNTYLAGNCVNNASGVKYKWVAFGFKEET